MKKDSLTTEKLRKKFKNNFDLCNFSIHVARNAMLGGRQGMTIQEMIDVVIARADESATKDHFNS